MVEDSFSGNREGREGRVALLKAGTERVGVSKEGELIWCKGKESPDRQEKNRWLKRLNSVLLNAEVRSISALKVQVSIHPPERRITQPLLCSECKPTILQVLNKENLVLWHHGCKWVPHTS